MTAKVKKQERCVRTIQAFADMRTGDTALSEQWRKTGAVDRRRAAEAASWKRFFGITPEAEEAQPGHTLGVILLGAVSVACMAAYVYARFHEVVR